MKLLLDTYALLWELSGSASLSGKARRAIEDAGNQKWVSVASLWEITIKSASGKLPLHEPLAVLLERLDQTGFVRRLHVETPHLLRLHELPSHHGDPFDRLLVAQALAEGMTLVSADPAMDAYGVPRLW